jgi:hypothetical protein
MSRRPSSQHTTPKPVPILKGAAGLDQTGWRRWRSDANLVSGLRFDRGAGEKVPLAPISFKRHRFPPDVRHAIWLYFRFTLSFRDVEEMLAKRGIELRYETISMTCS